MTLPEKIHDEAELNEVLTRPSGQLVEMVKDFTGSVAVLGIGGKTGYTVGVRLKRAIEAAGSKARVIGVSRFSSKETREALEKAGIETHAADLMDPEQVESMPDVDRIMYLAGLKFGTTGNEAATWAMNTLPAERVCRRYPGVPIVAYSTGAVYDMAPLTSGGATEGDPLEPRGEYANAAVGRERIFEWAGKRYGNPVCQIRLFYANDLRYGVIRDIADSVYSGTPIDISMGCVSLIWQGDAADQSLRAFAHVATPPNAINITGPELISVRYLAERLGELLGKEPVLTGEPATDALVGNTAKASGLFGYPEVSLDTMVRWTAEWVAAGGRSLGKPTHWEVRDGRY